MNHFTGGNLGSFGKPYGVRGDDEPFSSPLQLPFIRVLISGQGMVHIFFVVSGFVLSHKSLKLVRERDYDRLYCTLCSSIFRRGFRLFLPVFGVTFITMILRYLGWFPDPLPTLAEQFWDWCRAMWKLVSQSWGWDNNDAAPCNGNLWTIPMEFSHSLLLFVVLMALSRMKTYLRLALLLSIMIYCLKLGRWCAFEFLGGMGVAEIGLIQEARRNRAAALAAAKEEESLQECDEAQPLEPAWSGPTARRVFKLLKLASLVFALFCLGWPELNAEESAGYGFLARHTMEPYPNMGVGKLPVPWLATGAVQIVFAVQQTRPLQKLFVTPLAQYLADISFALYLVHGPVLVKVSPYCVPYLLNLVGGPAEAGMLTRMVFWFGGIVVIGSVAVWVADVIWRGVDAKSVQFARWLEAACMKA